jgi:hypothetical protein
MRSMMGKRSGSAALALFAFTGALTLAGSVQAAPFSRSEVCREYGFVAGTRAFRECRVNVRYYWSTGPCANAAFAAAHLRYCHVIPEFDF